MWTVNNTIVRNDGENIVATADTVEHAELIARAVNNHAELLAACKRALPFLEEYRERVIKGEITGKLLTGDYAPVNDLRRVIAKAEGREP